MLTIELTCCASCCARGTRSKTRILWPQASRLATISATTSRNVRQNRLGERSLIARYGADRAVRLAAAVGYEDVAQPPDGLDVLRLRRIGFDQFTQPRDLHVEAAVERLVFAATRKLHQFFARQWHARKTREHLEHREFACGERHRL